MDGPGGISHRVFHRGAERGRIGRWREGRALSPRNTVVAAGDGAERHVVRMRAVVGVACRQAGGTGADGEAMLARGAGHVLWEEAVSGMSGGEGTRGAEEHTLEAVMVIRLCLSRNLGGRCYGCMLASQGSAQPRQAEPARALTLAAQVMES